MKMRATLCLVFGVLVAGSVHAQKCLRTDTAQQCWAKYNPEPVAVMAAQMSATNTGVPAMTSPTGTSLRDFLSLFSAAVQTATVTDSQNAVTLDWNTSFFADDKLKVQTVFTDPKLSSALTTALGDNAAAITTLTESLDQTDDVTATLTYSPESRRFGRSVRDHEELLNALVDSAIGDSEFRQLQALAKVGLTTGPLNDKVTQFEPLAQAEQQLAVQNQNVIDAFVTLLNNQPQIYGTVVYHERNELVGPSELSAKFTYEMGTNSLNSFLKNNRARCGTADMIRSQTNGLADSTTCVGTLAAVAKQLGNDTAAKASNRLAVAIEYKQIRTNKFELTEPVAVSVDTPQTHSLAVSVTYGIPLATTMANREGRFDIAVNYDNVSDDEKLKDRLIATVTYTQKLSDMLTVPLSLVYANHADYLPTTDRKLGVHFGLNYKLPDLTP